MNGLIRFNNPAYKTIGLIGNINRPTSFNGQILSVKVEDTYEYLPKKIHTALKWVLQNYPDTQGVFKTDEDIFIKDMTHFTDLLQNNSNKPWWGFKIWNPPTAGPSELSLSKYTNKNILPHIGKKGVILAGAGYWLSNSLLTLISNYENFPEVGSEDQIISQILRDYGYIPEELKTEYSELVRQCNTPGCLYKIHKNPKIGKFAYCCYICSVSRNNHGPCCERIINE
jgi:hypothetical protein